MQPLVCWRAALKWDITENWSATLGAMNQKTESGAYNAFDPWVGDLETVRFHDDWRDDEYDLYSLTIEGDLGFAQLVSATSYYDRDIEEAFDITAEEIIDCRRTQVWTPPSTSKVLDDKTCDICDIRWNCPSHSKDKYKVRLPTMRR